MQQSIVENIWWVIPEKLAGVRKPEAEEIPQLKTIGIGAIVSVMDDPSNLDLYEQAGFAALWLPTKGGTAPNQEQLQALEHFIATQSHLGHAIAIHCSSGRRRTGTLLAAYLIRKGATFEEALKTVLTANPSVELREAQLDFLKSLAH